jgi:hypothetical protein
LKKKIIKHSDQNNFFVKEAQELNFQELFNVLVNDFNTESTKQRKKEIKRSLTDYAMNPSIIKKNLIDEDDSY